MEGLGYDRTGMGGGLSSVHVDDKAMIDLGRLGIVGHPTLMDDELACRLVSQREPAHL